MKPYLMDLAAAALFGMGLAISGMTMPEKVMGFLDIAGDWDPTLMMVMIGAIGVHMLAFRLIAKRQSPLFAGQFSLPSKTSIDKPLLIGAAIFGVGWGLAGFCPGPGIVAIISGQLAPLLFVLSMSFSIILYWQLQKLRSRG